MNRDFLEKVLQFFEALTTGILYTMLLPKRQEEGFLEELCEVHRQSGYAVIFCMGYTYTEIYAACSVYLDVHLGFQQELDNFDALVEVQTSPDPAIRIWKITAR